jgi:hypothetical protein
MRELSSFLAMPHTSPAQPHSLEHDPAWRWHAGLGIVLDQPLGKDGRDAPVAFEDPLIRDCLLPYLRLRIEGSYPPGISEGLYRATQKTVEIWSGRDREYHQLPHRLEAGLLAGRPQGVLLGRDDGVGNFIQELYEGLFFDARAHLDDREWLLRAVFSNPWPHTEAGACGLRSKVVAYGLGDVELQAFRGGRPSARALHLLDRLALARRYLDGVRSLGLLQSDDPANCFRRLFQEADRMRIAPDGPDGYDLPLAVPPDRRERLAGLRRQVPPPARLPKAKKTKKERCWAGQEPAQHRRSRRETGRRDWLSQPGTGEATKPA